MRSSRDDRIHDNRSTIDVHQDTRTAVIFTTFKTLIVIVSHASIYNPPTPHVRRSHMLQSESMGIILSYGIVTSEVKAAIYMSNIGNLHQKTHTTHAVEPRLELGGATPSTVDAPPQR